MDLKKTLVTVLDYRGTLGFSIDKCLTRDSLKNLKTIQQTLTA